MWTTLLSGVYLIYEIGFTGNTWLHAKLLFVAILIVYFFSMNFYRKQLEKNKCQKSGKFFRMYNEVPTVLMMIIVAMVVFKPF